MFLLSFKISFYNKEKNSQSYKWYPQIVHCRCFIIASFVASVVNDVWVVMVQSLDNDPGITETRGQPPAMFFSSHWTIGQKPQRRHCPVQHNPQHHSLWRWYRGDKPGKHHHAVLCTMIPSVSVLLTAPTLIILTPGDAPAPCMARSPRSPRPSAR